MRINSPTKRMEINICFAFIQKEKENLCRFRFTYYRRIAFCRNHTGLEIKFQIMAKSVNLSFF